MNGLLESQEPLKLSDEQLRIELNRDRDRLRNYSKCTGIPNQRGGIFDFNGHHQIRDLEIIISPSLESEFWSNISQIYFWLYYNGKTTISLSLLSNMILCTLLDRKPYQDPDNTWHIPLYCPEQPYDYYKTSYNDEHRLEWYESVSEHQNQKPTYPLHVEDLSFYLPYPRSNDLWTPHKIYDTNDRFIMLMISFDTPILLESVILHSNDEQMMVHENRIWSIDFMEFKIYGVSLDPQIQDWVHLAERMTYYTDHPESMILGLSQNLNIELKTYPSGCPTIRPIVFHHGHRFP